MADQVNYGRLIREFTKKGDPTSITEAVKEYLTQLNGEAVLVADNLWAEAVSRTYEIRKMVLKQIVITEDGVVIQEGVTEKDMKHNLESYLVTDINQIVNADAAPYDAILTGILACTEKIGQAAVDEEIAELERLEAQAQYAKLTTDKERMRFLERYSKTHTK